MLTNDTDDSTERPSGFAQTILGAPTDTHALPATAQLRPSSERLTTADEQSLAHQSTLLISGRPQKRSGIRLRPENKLGVQALKNTPSEPSPSSAQAPLRPRRRTHGEVIAGRFTLHDVIGEGAASLVYRAHDSTQERMVAVKMLRAELCGDPTLAARFRYEAQLTSSLFTERVVEILDLGELEDGTSYFAMELLEGETLDQMILGPLPSYRDITSIASQLAEGLEVAHNKNIIHRDLKPENIYVSHDGETEPTVKILDFGVATRPVGSALTRPGTVLGTPHYMAPEQALARSEVDGRADIYALGAIIFELVVGHPPFNEDDPMSLVMAHLSETPAVLKSVRADVPDGLSEIVARCLAKKPAERFQDAGALLAALKQIKCSNPKECQASRAATLLSQLMPVDSFKPSSVEVTVEGDDAAIDSAALTAAIDTQGDVAPTKRATKTPLAIAVAVFAAAAASLMYWL